jgi:hypothetical protein
LASSATHDEQTRIAAYQGEVLVIIFAQARTTFRAAAAESFANAHVTSPAFNVHTIQSQLMAPGTINSFHTVDKKTNIQPAHS